jgi:ubiquinone/menaquinone biosynthesis C-methylase UbiE
MGPLPARPRVLHRAGNGAAGVVVADIGCGTGVLASELARRECLVTGVDPSPAMLDVARHRPDGERVRWIEGDASLLDEAEYDLAIMTGHVAQVITDDQRWRETLAAT